MARILIIDDDEDWLVFVTKLLESAGHTPLPLLKAKGMMEEIDRHSPDLVITDIMMPGESGSIVYGQLRHRGHGSLPVVVCSSTKLKVRGDDKLLFHCSKQDAPVHLVNVVNTALKASAAGQTTEEGAVV
jgi:DNA-binding NtrC family response regulator